MRNTLFTVIVLFVFHSSARSQNAKGQPAVYRCIGNTHYEEWPEFPGGYKAKNQFISDNLFYPTGALREGIEGIVTIGFTVEPDGVLTEFRTLKGVYLTLDAEALRIAESMPNWIPGKHSGMAIRTQHTIDVVFKLPVE